MKKVLKADFFRRLSLAALVFLCCAAYAAGAAEAKRSFAAVPKQALVELKATVGKPFSSGLVFVNGRFIDPPYRIGRYGTAIRINGIQVTDEIIPWTEFLKTQAGARIEKIDPPASDAADASDASQPEEDAEDDDSSDDDLDDLFADDPKPTKKSSKPAVRRSSRPKPAPQPTTTVVLDGEFKPNDRTKAMVTKLNKERSRIETILRNGGSCFFGVRYSPMTVDRLPTDMFLSSMPSVMKANASFEPFASAARAKGITFLSETVLRDIFRNRLDYIRLIAREKAVKEGKWGTTP